MPQLIMQNMQNMQNAKYKMPLELGYEFWLLETKNPSLSKLHMHLVDPISNGSHY